MSVAIDGSGTAEATWRDWLDTRHWPSLDLTAAAGKRVVVVAAHPDDEVLGAGGLMLALRGVAASLVVVWATDGEASHPQSTVFSRARLASLRRDESRRALAALGVEPDSCHHLGLPDGGLSRHSGELSETLHSLVGQRDIVLAPWEGDGHPDHEAAGAAALAVSPQAWRYPVWMWHWAQPGDQRVPWPQVRTVAVPDLGRKAAAVAEFVTQVQPIGDTAADAAVLPPPVLARFARRSEWFVT